MESRVSDHGASSRGAGVVRPQGVGHESTSMYRDALVPRSRGIGLDFGVVSDSLISEHRLHALFSPLNPKPNPQRKPCPLDPLTGNDGAGLTEAGLDVAAPRVAFPCRPTQRKELSVSPTATSTEHGTPSPVRLLCNLWWAEDPPDGCHTCSLAQPDLIPPLCGVHCTCSPGPRSLRAQGLHPTSTTLARS